jgi:hypothetical protein
MVLFLDQDRLVLARIERAVLTVLKRLELLTETVMATMDDVRARVDAQRTVTQSVVTLLEELRRQLATAAASQDPAVMQALADSIEANTAVLAAAVTSHTPAQNQPAEQAAQQEAERQHPPGQEGG